MRNALCLLEILSGRKDAWLNQADLVEDERDSKLFTFETRDDDRQRNWKRLNDAFSGTLFDCYEILGDRNCAGAGVFVRPNQDEVRAVVVSRDWRDWLKRPPILLPPTGMVSTYGNVDIYWLLNSPSKDLKRLEHLQRQMTASLEGDETVNLFTPMRLPDFFDHSHPLNLRMVELCGNKGRQFSDLLKYSIEELEHAFKPNKDASQVSSAKKGKPANDWGSLKPGGVAKEHQRERLTCVANILLQKKIDPLLAASLVRAFNQRYNNPPKSDVEVEEIIERAAARALAVRQGRLKS